jgi:hypothetical protein
MAPGSQGLELEPGLQSSHLGLGLSRDGDCQHRESCSNPTHNSYQGRAEGPDQLICKQHECFTHSTDPNPVSRGVGWKYQQMRSQDRVQASCHHIL